MVALVAGVVGAARPAAAHTPHDVIVDVVVSPAYARDRTVLTISNNRVLRSTDGGRDFHETVEGLDSTVPMARLAFAPSKPSVVYLSSRGAGVYRSDDRGLHWRATAPDAGVAANGAELAVSPATPDVVVVRGGLFGGLVRSDDGGRTWASVPGVSGVRALAFVPGRTGRVVAVGAAGRVLVSNDDGRTFEAQVVAPDTLTAIAAGSAGSLFAGTESGAVLRSDDAGGSWANVGRMLPGAPINALLVASDDRRERTVWASTWHRGVFRSSDRGRTWVAHAPGATRDEQADRINSPQFRSLALATLRDGRQRLYLAAYDGLFVSTEGARWHEVQTQADYPSGLAVSPEYASDRTVALNTYVKGSFISRTAGNSFTPSNRGLTVPGLAEGNKLLPLRRMHNIVFSPDYGSDRSIFTATWTRFVKSVDGGRSWKSVVVAPPPPDTELRQFVIAVSPAYRDDQTIFLGTRQGDLYRSTRGGVAGSWTTAAELGSGTRSIVMSPAFATDRTMVAGTEAGVMKSVDGGTSWTKTGPTELALLAISPGFPTDRTLFAGTRSGLLVTRDGGETWTRTGLAPAGPARGVAAVAVSPAFVSDRTVLVSVDGTGLFRSRDQGRTFEPMGDDLRERGLVIADFDRPTSSPIQFSAAFATDRTVFAYAQEAVLRSTDGGDRWVELPVRSAASMVREERARGQVAASSGGHDARGWILGGVTVAVVGGVGAAVTRQRLRRSARHRS